MALDAIAEVFVRVVIRVFVEILFVGLFYWPGWLTLRILTVGRYPPGSSNPHNREFVALVGFAMALLLFSIIYTGNG